MKNTSSLRFFLFVRVRRFKRYGITFSLVRSSHINITSKYMLITKIRTTFSLIYFFFSRKIDVFLKIVISPSKGVMSLSKLVFEGLFTLP